MEIRIEFNGELYEQRCNLFYGDQLIYKGYVDNLVTSINGYLELKLNYGTSRISSVIVKKLGDIIFWIPINDRSVNEKYNNIIISVSDMRSLWDKLGYDLTEDIHLISSISRMDLKLLWVINSGLRFQFDLYGDIAQLVTENITSFTNESSGNLDEKFHYLLKEDWKGLDLNYLKLIEFMHGKLVVYLDDSNRFLEWIPLFEDETQNTWINLGNNWCIRVSNKE
ncbi:hypothetical protein [Clostridium sp.]|uniref:hypothetical protein n=1 Tax=Clostridium sp. TaxID=1506 RepID=UPI002FCC00E9